MNPASASVSRTVLWLPSHPAVGAVSMDRYWRELEIERRRQDAEARAIGSLPSVNIRCALPEPAPERSHRAGRWTRFWHKYVAYPWQARRGARAGVDAVHVLDHSFAHLLARMPMQGVYKIVTVHDLAPLRDTSDLTPAQRDRFRRTVEYLKLADLLLADSQPTADDTAEMLGIAPGKIRVLPLGVDVRRFMRQPAGPPPWLSGFAGRKVVLSVGSAAARKNLQSLPAILREVRAAPAAENLTLARIGEPLPEALRESLRQILGPEGLVELGSVSEEELIAAYQRADALIFPSHLEGFGFPVLEAMAAGCPVVCSDASSLPEVGGEAALYFHPDDAVAAARHLRAALNDPAVRQTLVAAGHRQADRLSWQQHYAALLNIYRSVMS